MKISQLPNDYIGYVSTEDIIVKVLEMCIFLSFGTFILPIVTIKCFGSVNWWIGFFPAAVNIYCIIRVYECVRELIAACRFNRNYAIEQGKIIARLREDNRAYTEKELIELGKADAFESECE